MSVGKDLCEDCMNGGKSKTAFRPGMHHGDLDLEAFARDFLTASFQYGFPNDKSDGFPIQTSKSLSDEFCNSLMVARQ